MTHPRTVTKPPGPRALPAALLLLALAACAPSLPPPARPAPGPEAAAAIAVLMRSAEAWNRGDLDGFVAPYHDSATFVTSTGLVRGREAIRQRYVTGYWSNGAPAGLLTFRDVEATPLGPDHLLTVGRYVLTDRATSRQSATGIFSLVWIRTADGWRILHDQSS